MRVTCLKKIALVGLLGLATSCSQISDDTAGASLELGEPDPDLGMIATITPAMVSRAASLVTEGKVYGLGVVTGPDTVPWPGRSYSIKTFGGDLDPVGANRLTSHDDRLETHVGIGSQLDGLGHIGRDGAHYGGARREDFFTDEGLKKFGTENIPPIATRGVLVNIAKYRGVGRIEPLSSFGSDEIEAAAAAQGITIQAGDVVLFHTGWLTMADEDAEQFIEGQPGLNLDGAEYLAELGVVAVGADNAGLETMAFEDDILFPVHQSLLVDHGIYILESMNTAELAADEVSEFFFVLGHARFAGSVQAVINPVAIK